MWDEQGHHQWTYRTRQGKSPQHQSYSKLQATEECGNWVKPSSPRKSSGCPGPKDEPWNFLILPTCLYPSSFLHLMQKGICLLLVLLKLSQHSSVFQGYYSFQWWRTRNVPSYYGDICVNLFPWNSKSPYQSQLFYYFSSRWYFFSPCVHIYTFTT